MRVLHLATNTCLCLLLLICPVALASTAASVVAVPQVESTQVATAPSRASEQRVVEKTSSSATRPDDRMLLEEYQLAERVQARVLSELKLYGAILAIALAFVGFIGAGTLIDAISRRVEKTIRDAMEKDVETLRTRTQVGLVDLQVAVAGSKSLEARSTEYLASVRTRLEELDDLGIRYENLHGQIQKIQLAVESAAQAAEESSQNTESLRTAVAESFAGRPSLLSYNFDWFRGGNIQGTNFGSKPGELTIHISSRYEPKDDSPPEVHGFDVVIPKENFKQWNDTEIRFELPPDAKAKIDEFRDQQSKEWDRRGMPKGSVQRLFNFMYMLKTADDRRVVGD